MAESPAKEAFEALLFQVKPKVERRLEAVFARQLKSDGKQGTEVEAMIEQARLLSLRGGKRLRAGLVLAGQRATEASRTSIQTALGAGTAIELLQSYFLIHDDWMDQDAVRRGGPSVHAALEKQFGSAHLGACGAILGGDYLVALATQQLLQAIKHHPRQAELIDAFCQLQLDAVVGQQLDVIGQTKNAERIYELKTSSYTVAGPLELGALLANASADQLRSLRRFSVPVGVAFQLRDDLLSVFGTPEQTGKPFGNDLTAGKWTWVLQHALDCANRTEQRSIKKVFGQPRATAKQLRDAVAALESSGARLATEDRIRALRRRALRGLDKSSLSGRGKNLLAAAASTLIDRSS